MAKRFTDTDKYKKPFLRGLPGAYKLLWDYICNDCNHAGIWIVDFEIAHIYLGKDVNVERNAALRFFNADKIRVIELDGGTRWFIVSFIEFQYGQLNPQNRAHSSVITALKSYGLWDDDKNELIINKPHTSPLQGAMDMDKEKEMDKDMDRGGAGGNSHSGGCSRNNNTASRTYSTACHSPDQTNPPEVCRICPHDRKRIQTPMHQIRRRCSQPHD